MIVRYTRQATAELDEAFAYIARERPRAAEAMVRTIQAAVDGLRQFPERGRLGREPGTREPVVPRTPFVVSYRIRGEEIQVLAVLHGKRDWPPRTPGD